MSLNRRSVLMGTVAVAVAATVGLDSAAAQAHPTTVAPDAIRHIQSVAPKSGPPGTLVSISTLNLPIEARVHVGVGAMREGFEALTEAEQGQWGEIAVRVQIPENTSWERPIVFVAFNAVFAPIGMSDPFHVTDERGMVLRNGRVTRESEDCLTFRDADGYLYELTGTLDGLEEGAEVSLEGVYFETGECLQGPTIGVSAVTR